MDGLTPTTKSVGTLETHHINKIHHISNWKTNKNFLPFLVIYRWNEERGGESAATYQQLPNQSQQQTSKLKPGQHKQHTSLKQMGLNFLLI